MNALTKNKEEIEKINEGCGNKRNDILKNEFGTSITIICGKYYNIGGGLEGMKLCPTCQERRQERIKTSILWCEEIIRLMRDDVLEVYDKDFYEEVEKYQSHLNWLKEQEKDL